LRDDRGDEEVAATVVNLEGHKRLLHVGWIKPTPMTGHLIFQPLRRPPDPPDGWQPVYVLFDIV
jgi:hypothetical protein